MTEFKSSIIDRIKHFYLLHPVLIAVIIAFVVMLLVSGCSVQKASAESMPQSGISALDGFFADFSNYNDFKSVLNQIYNDTSYFVLQKTSTGFNGTAFFTSDINVMPFTITSYDSLSSPEGFLASYNRTAFSLTSNYPATGVILYSIYFSGNNVYSIEKAVVYESCSFTFSDNSPYFYGARSNISTVFGSHLGTQVSNVSPLFVLGELPKFNAYYSRYDGTYTPNLFPSVEDDRLQLYSLKDNTGANNLVVDLSKFRGFSPAAIYTFDNIIVTLNCDGSDVSFELDSSTSTITDIYDYQTSVYSVMTSYSFFGVEHYDDVYVSGVKFDYIQSSSGGSLSTSFNIKANYWLKQITVPVVPEDIAKDTDVIVDKLSVTEITKIGNDFQFKEGEYVRDLSDIVPPDNFTFAEVGLSNVSLSTLIDDGFSDSAWAYFINTLVTSAVGEEKVIYDFLNSSEYPSTFDYILFDYVEKVDGEYDHYYFYYITVSGRIRMLNNIMADLYVDVNQNAYNTAAIYDFLYTRLNDFENQSLQQFVKLVDNTGSANSWLQTINIGISNLEDTCFSGFASVVTAINNIDIPDPVSFDDSDILDKIDDLITAFNAFASANEVDTPQECIQYYYDNPDGNIPFEYFPAFYEGLTLDFLYSLPVYTSEESSVRLASVSDSASKKITVDDISHSFLFSMFMQFKSAFNQSSAVTDLNAFLSAITKNTPSHKYYWHLFDADYDPEEFDGIGEQ